MIILQKVNSYINYKVKKWITGLAPIYR